MPKPSKKARSRTNRKRYAVSEAQFFDVLVASVVDDECVYWDDFHGRVKQVFDYAPALDAEGEVVRDDDGDIVFLNPENEGAELTMTSLKARCTRVRKKFQSETGQTFALFEKRPKAGKAKAPPPDFASALEKLKAAGKLKHKVDESLLTVRARAILGDEKVSEIMSR